MSHEYSPVPVQRNPREIYGLTERENLNWRVDQNRFQEIINDEKTIIHSIQESSNTFGEFLFVTTSRPGMIERVAMTFYGQGFHEQRERWITDEWFWYGTNLDTDKKQQHIDKEKANELIQQQLEKIQPYIQKGGQTNRGKLFEFLADLTDEDGALAEMEDLESLSGWHTEMDQQTLPEEPPPTGEYLLDPKSREKLPPLRSGDELGLEALAQVKFFTPDGNWTWYASEFDGEDIFFGLVSGFELEFGNFSLAELQQVVGPLGLPIERDLHFERKKLGELLDWHRQQHNQQP